VNKTPIDSWNIFDLSMRIRAVQAVYVGLTWAIFFWSVVIMFALWSAS